MARSNLKLWRAGSIPLLVSPVILTAMAGPTCCGVPQFIGVAAWEHRRYGFQMVMAHLREDPK
jgi:hypothetical protein